MSGENKRLIDYKALLLGIIVSFGVTLFVIVLEAFLMSVVDIPDTFASPLSSVALAVGSLVGGFFVSQKTKEKGMLQGGALGLALFAAVTLISLIFDSSGISLVTFIHAVITILSGCVGGILGVNTGSKRKF